MDPREPANRAGSSDPPRRARTTLRGSDGDAPSVVDVLPDVPRTGKGGCFVDHCDARAAPTDPDGPLAGLTFAVKDNLDVAGHRTGCGQPTWLDTHPEPARQHAPPVASLPAAGAACVGKTQMDELAGRCRARTTTTVPPINPAAVEYVPGGSSSGSAVAVAAGYADVALGTDTAGSVRVPASYCGLCGFRPTHGRCGRHARVRPARPVLRRRVVRQGRDEISKPDAARAPPPWGAWDTTFDLRFDGAIARDAFELCDEETRATLREAVARGVRTRAAAERGGIGRG